MRAVNLIPTGDRGERRAGSGLASYVVIGFLTLVVLGGAAYTLANRSIADRREELTNVQARAQASATEAQALASYTTFSALRQKRAETVRTLAAARFDWSHALHEVARTIPSDAWLISMRGTTTPSAVVEGGVGDPLRSSLPNPALELVGCTTSQSRVAAVISNLRRIEGVQRVSLSSSEKAAIATGKKGSAPAGTGSGDGDCRQGDSHFPQFAMTLFFETPSGSATAAQTAATGATP